LAELEKWLATIRISWSKQLAYKLNFLLLVVGPTLVFFFVKYNLWRSIYELQGVETIQGYDLKAMLHYQIWGMIVGFLAQGFQNMNLAEDIRLGRISSYLVYPFGFWQFHTAGFIAFQLLQTLVALVTLAILRMTGMLDAWNWLGLLQGIGFSLMMGLFWYQVSFVLGLAAFWLEETWVLRVMFVTIAQFMSGAILPLEIYPDWLVRLLKWTPFPYLTYVPVKVFMGTWNEPLWDGVLTVSVWLGLVGGLSYFVWRRGLRLYTAAGM